jgi:predicted nucleic acid-binding protein
MIVLDASAVVELLLGTAEGSWVAGRIANERESLHAPHLLDVEVASALRRYEASRIMTPARAAQALTDFESIEIARYAHDVLLTRIWQLRRNVSAYDAAYVALAEVLDAPLLTGDGKLARAAGHHARMEWIGARR